MRQIYKKYGNIIEITEIEKTPNKVRVPVPRKGTDVHNVRRLDNLRRVGKTCVRRVSSALEEFGCPLLVTLTFKGDASDAAFASDSLSGFQLRLRTKYPNAQSLFIPELSPTGRIHFHGLLFNVPLRLGDTYKNKRCVSHGDERETRELASLWREGYVDAVQTDGSGRLAHYVSKYITKGAGHVMFSSMRLMRISHGFPKELIVKDEILAEKLATSYAKTHTPFKEWERTNPFLGKIKKTFYYQDEERGIDFQKKT